MCDNILPKVYQLGTREKGMNEVNGKMKYNVAAVLCVSALCSWTAAQAADEPVHQESGEPK